MIAIRLDVLRLYRCLQNMRNLRGFPFLMPDKDSTHANFMVHPVVFSGRPVHFGFLSVESNLYFWGRGGDGVHNFVTCKLSVYEFQVLYKSSHSVFTTIQRIGNIIIPYFTDEETEARRDNTVRPHN